MKNCIFLLSFFLLGMILAGMDSIAESRLFHQDFENGVDAAFAAGSSKGTFLAKEKEPQFVDGCKGKGFLTGAANEALRYQTDKNLNGQTGTLTFWQKKLENVEFNQNDRKHHIFFELHAPARNTLFYKYGDGFRPWLLEQYKVENKQQTISLDLPRETTYDKNAWHQYGYVWDKNKVSLYMDGVCIGSKERLSEFPADVSKGTIAFGQSWGSKVENNRIMDEISIYGKAMTPAEMYSLYVQERIEPPQPEISIAPTDGTMKLDGRKSPGEFENAAAFPLLFNHTSSSVAEVPSVVYLTYDKENLYFFLHSPIGKKAFEKAHTELLNGMFLRQRTTHDMDLDNDDSLILDFLQDSVNRYMAVNTLDVRYDYTITNGKEIRLDWNPAWKTVSLMTESGWDMEGCIPLKELGLSPEDGTVFFANFVRNWKQIKLESDSLAQDRNSGKGGFRKNKKYGKFIFSGKNCAVVQMDRMERFCCSGADFSVSVRNPSAQTQDVLAELRAGNLVLESKKYHIASGETTVFSFQKSFASSQMDLNFKVTSGKETLFFLDNPVFSLEDIQIRIAPIPSADKIFIAGSFPQLNLNPENAKVMITVVQKEKTILTKEIPLKELAFRTDVPCTGLENESCRIIVKLLENGRTVTEKSIEYQKQAMPEWYGNQIGLSEKVPSPWLPVKAEGAKVTLLNNGYDFGNSPLPEKIIAAGQEILSSPIRIETENGALKMQNHIQSVKDTEAVICGTGELPGICCTMKTTVEYDGFMWHTFTLTPEQKGTTLRKLQILVPLKPEYGELIVPYDYTLSTTGKLDSWHGGLRPLWIGNADRGLSFAAEHAHNWNLTSYDTALEAKRTADGAFMRINLVNKPLVLNGPETFEFSFQATPAKPVEQGYRRMRFCTMEDANTIFKDENNADLLIWWSGSWSNVSQSGGDVCYPDAKTTETAEKLNRKNAGGSQISVLPYFQLHETWGESPEFKQFGYEWIAGENMPVIMVKKSNDNRTPVCQNSRSFQDFTLWGLQKFVKQANVRGFYFDMSQPQECTNLQHGCGYVKNGQVLPTTNIRGARNMVKRIYTMLRENRPDSFIVYHNSGQVCAQVHGFAGAFIDGENFVSRLQKNRGYEEILRPDVFRAEYMGHNFGVQGVVLPEFRISDNLRNFRKGKPCDEAAAKAEYEELGSHQNYLYGLGLLHDSQISTGWTYHEESKEQAFRILRKIDYSHGNLQFIPYWSQKIASCDSKQEIVSFYQGKDFAVAVIMNLSKEKRTIRLNLDLQKLGISGKIQPVNLEYPEAVLMEEDTLILSDVPGMQYRAVKLESCK